MRAIMNDSFFSTGMFTNIESLIYVNILVEKKESVIVGPELPTSNVEISESQSQNF